MEEKKSAQSELYRRGKTVYMTYCIACHHTDPKKIGSVGPDIFGSSVELVRARVLLGKYPEGYNPKRTTSLMVPMPELEPEINALHAFLNDLQ